VLSIGIKDDPHITAVNLAIEEIGGSVVLFDPSDDEGLPQFLQGRPESGQYIWADGRCLDFDKVQSVFCRYAIDSLRPAANLPDLEKFGALERLQGILAPLRAVPSTNWINDPWLEARADCKIFQRTVAKSLGLHVPIQIISNNLDEIETSFGDLECVVKPLSDTSLGVTSDDVYCERIIPTDNFLAPFTTTFDFAVARSCRSDGTPLLIQEKIPKCADLRCMIVDDDVYAFAIPYSEGQPVDFRIAPVNSIQPYRLSAATQERLVALNRILNVRYSACDLLLTAAGKEIFLEANVSGNWLFCDIIHDMQITRDIARKLLGA